MCLAGSHSEESKRLLIGLFERQQRYRSNFVNTALVQYSFNLPFPPLFPFRYLIVFLFNFFQNISVKKGKRERKIVKTNEFLPATSSRPDSYFSAVSVVWQNTK